jgi:hypothetical protein
MTHQKCRHWVRPDVPVTSHFPERFIHLYRSPKQDQYATNASRFNFSVALRCQGDAMRFRCTTGTNDQTARGQVRRPGRRGRHRERAEVLLKRRAVQISRGMFYDSYRSRRRKHCAPSQPRPSPRRPIKCISCMAESYTTFRRLAQYNCAFGSFGRLVNDTPVTIGTNGLEINEPVYGTATKGHTGKNFKLKTKPRESSCRLRKRAAVV